MRKRYFRDFKVILKVFDGFQTFLGRKQFKKQQQKPKKNRKNTEKHRKKAKTETECSY